MVWYLRVNNGITGFQEHGGNIFIAWMGSSITAYGDDGLLSTSPNEMNGVSGSIQFCSLGLYWAFSNLFWLMSCEFLYETCLRCRLNHWPVDLQSRALILWYGYPRFHFTNQPWTIYTCNIHIYFNSYIYKHAWYNRVTIAP